MSAWFGMTFDEAVADRFVDRKHTLPLEIQTDLFHVTAGECGQLGCQLAEHVSGLLFVWRHLGDRAIELQPWLR
jgi:hypothetical protein